MSIIRAPRKTGNFYILDKRISEDRRLTWAARGLLIYLLGKPDHWCVSVQALVNETHDARINTRRDAIWALLKELIETGYCVRTQSRKPDGTLGDMDYAVSETPEPPRTAQPGTAQPGTANPTLVRTDGSKDLQKGRKEGKPANFQAPAPMPAAPLPAPVPTPAPRPAPAAPSPSHFENEQPEQPPATAPAPAAPVDTLAPLVNRINAQRANNGKGPYTPADVAKLRAQAAQAGITAEQAAEWVLERPTRNFFQSSYYTAITPAPEPAPAPVQQPAPTPEPPPTPEQLAENKRIAAEAMKKIWGILGKERKNQRPGGAQQC